MKRLTLLLACFILSMGLAIAQNKAVKGIVFDENGEPAIGASVVIKGTNLGVTTGVDGRFTFASVPNDAKTITIKYIGAENQEVTISEDMKITLKNSDALLNEIVVIGYGSGKKLGTIAGSVSQISSEVIKDKPVANVVDALQGKVAGLQVYTSSGEPSATSSVRLNGVGSLSSSNTPLYILDGAPVSSGAILSMNPNDFESVTVLKGASATSIYGSRASNGVIVYTSKKGSLSQAAEVTVRGQYGVSSLADKRFYTDLLNSKQLSDFWTETGIQTKAQMDALVAKYPNDFCWGDYLYSENTPTYQGDISIRGGGGKTSYFVSASYFDQTGVAPHSGYSRYTGRSNIESRAFDWLKFGANISLSYDMSETNGYMGNNAYGGSFYRRALPFYSPYDKDGNRTNVIEGTGGMYNPYYLYEKQPGGSNTSELNAIPYLEISPVKGFILRSQFAIDAYDATVSSKILPSADFRTAAQGGRTYEAFSRGVTRTITNTAEYKFNLNKTHFITALLGQEGIDFNYRSFNGQSEGQVDDRLMLLQVGALNKTLNSAGNSYAYLSYFGQLNYNYNEKYFVDLSIRNDQSSRFGKDNRSAMFYSVGLMWDMKKENFLSDVSWLTMMSVKGEIGTQGNSSIGDYTHLATTGTTSPYNGSPGWAIGNSGNSHLTWEKQMQSNLSVIAEINNKYRFNLEYYLRKTSDMLVAVPYPYTSGFGTVTSNVGKMQNQGFNATIDLDLVKTKDFYVGFNAVVNYNANKITELFDGYQRWDIPNTGVSWVVGQPISYYYPIFAGIDPADGKQMWYVPGDDPTVTTMDPNNVTKVFNESALRQNTGKDRYTPITGGFGVNAKWKGIAMQADFAVVKGKYLINNDRYFTENPRNAGTGTNQSYRVLDYWKQPGDVTLMPKYGETMQFDTHLLEDASFVRMKNITLSYSFPSSLMKKTKIFKGIRVYTTGRNLLTFTDYLGQDPEQDSNLQMGIYPNTRQYSFGIDITF